MKAYQNCSCTRCKESVPNFLQNLKKHVMANLLISGLLRLTYKCDKSEFQKKKQKKNTILILIDFRKSKVVLPYFQFLGDL